jgi:thiamine transport system permease protein
MDPGMDRGDAQVRPSPLLRNVKKSPGVLLWLIPLGFLVLFFFIPLSRIIAVMVSKPGVVSGSILLTTLGFTIWQAVLSTGLTFVVGLPLAYLFSHFNFQGKKLFRLAVTLPFILPTVVVAVGFNALLGPRGWLNLLLMNVFSISSPPISLLNTLGIILLAHVFYNTSILIRVVGTAWSALDNDIREAAQVLGGSPFNVFRKVTLQLLKPSLLSAGLLIFLFDFTSFGVILLLGGPSFSTLETEIYTQTLSMLNLRMAGILSLIQMACTLVVTIFYGRINSQRSSEMKPGKGIDAVSPSQPLQRVFVFGAIVVIFLLFGLPVLSLVIRSFISYNAGLGTSSLTFENYSGLFVNRRQTYFYVPPARAGLNSFMFAAFSTGLSLLLGICTAYARAGKRIMKKAFDGLIMLPLGTSAVTLGLGFLITFNKPPFDIASFPFLIPIAHSLIAFPFVLRTVAPVLDSIPQNLKDAAAVLGSSRWKTWWHVEVPIISRAALVGGTYAFAISLGEFGATSFLARPDMPTLPVAIYRFLSLPGDLNYGQALAMAVMLLLLCAICLSIIDRIPLPGKQDY